MSKKDDNISRVYSALASPIRRKIVEFLRSHGKAGFKELHESVMTSVGALYHHLDALEGIVTQGPDKKYELTEGGRPRLKRYQLQRRESPSAPPHPSAVKPSWDTSPKRPSSAGLSFNT